MSLNSLEVTGQAVNLKTKFPFAFLTRKIYNPKYFFDDSYHHEIANHYRDLKYNPRSKRAHRRKAYVHLCKGSDSTAQNKCHFKPPIKEFPRFAEVCKQERGRKTLCKSKPPDDTYDHTVRRIRQTDTCEALRKLFQKQLAWQKFKKPSCVGSNRSPTNRPTTTQTTNGTTTTCKGIRNIIEKSSIETESERQSSETWLRRKYTSRKDYSNWYLPSYDVDSTLHQQQESQPPVPPSQPESGEFILKSEGGAGNFQKPNFKFLRYNDNFVNHLVKQPVQKQQQHNYSIQKQQKQQKVVEKEEEEEEKLKSSTLSLVLQLAVDYYEQGYLKNVRYLKSIGRRNQKRKEEEAADEGKQKKSLSLLKDLSANFPSSDKNSREYTGGEGTLAANNDSLNSNSNDSFTDNQITKTKPFGANQQTFENRKNQTNLEDIEALTINQNDSQDYPFRINIKPLDPTYPIIRFKNTSTQTTKRTFKQLVDKSKHKILSAQNACNRNVNHRPSFRHHRYPLQLLQMNKEVSMNDYLNANSSSPTKTLFNNNYTTSLASCNYPNQFVTSTSPSTTTYHHPQHHPYPESSSTLPFEHQPADSRNFYPDSTSGNQNFHDLIDHLNQLQLNDPSSLLLPRITLTDYSTHNLLQHSTPQQELYPQSPPEQQQINSNSFLLKETRFLFNQRLDIPIHSDYQSEARPP